MPLDPTVTDNVPAAAAVNRGGLYFIVPDIVRPNQGILTIESGRVPRRKIGHRNCVRPLTAADLAGRSFPEDVWDR